VGSADGDDVASNVSVFCAGDVLFGKLRPNLRKVAVAQWDGVCSTEILVVRPRHELVTSSFAFHLLSTEPVAAHCIAHATGTHMPRISWQLLLEMDVAAPTLDEQRRAALVLDTHEAAVEAAQAYADALAGLHQTAVEAEFALQRLQAWAEATLGDIANVRSGITKGRKTKGVLRSMPFLRAANVQNGRLTLDDVRDIEVTDDERDRFLLERGDVLLLEGGNLEDVGRGWIWDGEVDRCLHQNHVFRARVNPDGVLPRFLAHFITSPAARRYCLSRARQTSHLATLNKTNVSLMPVPVPPMEVQAAMVARLDATRVSADSAAAYASATARARDAHRHELLATCFFSASPERLAA
jgi:type I restriction enzyme S subunit